MHLMLCFVALASAITGHALLNDRTAHESKKLQLLAFGDSLTEGCAESNINSIASSTFNVASLDCSALHLRFMMFVIYRSPLCA